MGIVAACDQNDVDVLPTGIPAAESTLLWLCDACLLKKWGVKRVFQGTSDLRHPSKRYGRKWDLEELKKSRYDKEIIEDSDRHPQI